MPNWKKLIVSGSDATLNSLNVTTNVVADEITANTINATTFNSTVVSSSVVFTSGSNIIGDELTDNHQITGSVFITGSLNVEGTISASSYQGDGSQLTGLVADVVETATVFESFTNSLSVAVPHNFNTKNVIATVYQGDEQIIPKSVTTTTDNVVTITFNTPTTGRVVVAKGGHVVSGSIQQDLDLSEIDQHIIPLTDNTYDLGSPTKQWRDLYLSSASLYIDGTKVISSNTDTLTFTTDVGQSIKLLETGGDDITLQTDTGNIELKGTVEVLTGKKITDSAGSVIRFGNSIGITGSIETTGTVDGIDLQAFSSSVATSLSNVASDWDSVTNKPAGIVSSSAQITSLTSYTETFTSQTAVTASHSLGTKNVTVSIYGSDDYMIFPTSIKTHDTNNVYVQFNSSRSGRIVITK